MLHPKAQTPSAEIRNEGLSFGFDTDAAGADGAVTLSELVHTTGGIDETLLTGEERMATSADTHAKVFDGGGRMIHSTAGAGDRRFVQSRMEVRFHNGIGT